MPFADLVAQADRAIQIHLGAVPVLYQPEVGDAVEVQGMFDEQGLVIEQGEAGTEQMGPVVFLLLEDLPVHPDSDNPTLTIEGDDYQIRERHSDGMGGIRLLLHQVS